MSIESIKNTEKLVEELISKNTTFLEEKKNLKEFVKIFFSKIVQSEILNKKEEYLIYLADSTFSLLEKRNKNEVKINIFNPSTFKEEKKTIIEVITDDSPFIIDSLSNQISKLGFSIDVIINKVISVKRSSKGILEEISKKNNDTSFKTESIVHFHISQINDKSLIENLKEKIKNILSLVKISTNDWTKMLDKLDSSKEYIKNHSNKYEDLSEAIDFLDWLKSDAFIFLGFKEYSLKESGDKIVFSSKKTDNFGICSSSCPDDLTSIDKDIYRQENLDNNFIEISKCWEKSPIHRDVHFDNIRVKKYDNKGNVIGEFRFIGLFTSIAFYQRAENIPIIRQKISSVIKKANFSKSSHNCKELTSTLYSYPREELLQTDTEDLFNISMGVVSLSGRSASKIFPRVDKFKRFISILCYLPRTNYSAGVRHKIQILLERECNGYVSAHYTQISDSSFARVHFIINPNTIIAEDTDYKKIEEEISKITTNWSDDLRENLRTSFNEKDALSYHNSFTRGFSLAYTEHFTSKEASLDISSINELLLSKNPIIKLHYSLDIKKLSLKIYSLENQVILSKVMPILENFGLEVIDEHTYKIKPIINKERKKIWLHNFKIEVKGIDENNFRQIQPLFEDAIKKSWLGINDNDILNSLVLTANLTARDISLIRAYCRYLKQTKFSYSFSFIAATLYKNSRITANLVHLFYLRFKDKNESEVTKIKESIENNLTKITNIAEDTVIRKILEIFEATLRTNFFQTDKNKEYKNYISFKFASQNITDIPLPKPYREIFVYSPKMEGIHLRGGKVARGGLRWSDRTEDFRTEVHGLVKAQITKNAVIVPTGSKGGFIVKDNLSGLSRDEFIAKGIEAYKTFLSGMLDITDNIIEGKITPPRQVVRLDEEDPYLVVAADKGTATFSDIANEVSKEYKFWLGDAFASGGSQGYDHKKMGITAKGAWISVMRHFYESGKDINKEEFTAVGVGDMSGDVFGNGMLLSENIKLIAAFNHLHIFIDPTPDSKKSYLEREKLFSLPRSSWEDYNKNIISHGGAIFSRSEKSIKLNKQIKEALDIFEDELTPDELIKRILMSPVELIWNGGIGTYIKSSSESHADVGDRANDLLRVDAKSVRAKIIGEGGNLGLTQKGRIEFALNGGRINTDSLDNSAGVDCSDHEVNIKIALQAIMGDKKLKEKERNNLLAEMTEEVNNLVLRNNLLQTRAISVAEYQGSKALEQQDRLMKTLERKNILNRAVEFLPSSEEIKRRHSEGTGLTRPELSVLLSYSKIYLYDNILKSDIPDEEYFQGELSRYFPAKLYNKYTKYINNHALKREIIATYVTNSLINHLGITFFNRLREDTGLKMCDIARAYIIARDSFGLRELWQEIHSLDTNVPAKVQIEMYREITVPVERSTAWLMRGIAQPITNIREIIEDFSKKISKLYQSFDNIVTKDIYEHYQGKLTYYINNNVPSNIAQKVASMDAMSTACQISHIATGKKVDVSFVAKIYFQLDQKLHIRYLRKISHSLKINNYWDKLSIKALVDTLFDQQIRITTDILKYSLKEKTQKLSVDAVIEKWSTKNYKQISRFNDLIIDLQSHDNPDFAMLTVATNRIKSV